MSDRNSDSCWKAFSFKRFYSTVYHITARMIDACFAVHFRAVLHSMFLHIIHFAWDARAHECYFGIQNTYMPPYSAQQ
jgi:hypothetical protein